MRFQKKKKNLIGKLGCAQRMSDQRGLQGDERVRGYLLCLLLTICNEVLRHMQSHLHGKWTGHLTAAHHRQDAGAHSNQRQGCLVHWAF